MVELMVINKYGININKVLKINTPVFVTLNATPRVLFGDTSLTMV